MKVVVFVKHVPDTRVPIRMSLQTNGLEPSDMIGIMNPADARAVEEAVRIIETVGGEVVLISMGTGEAEATLRQGLAMGAARAILIDDDSLRESDGYVTAMVLGRLARSEQPDLVLCGARSLDVSAGQVGPGVAEVLDMPHLSGVASIDVTDDGKRAVVLRKLERGHREKVECTLPAMLSVDVDLNEPRYPGLPDLMNALVAVVDRVDLSTLGLSRERVGLRGSLTRVTSLMPPRPRPKRIFTPSSSLSAKDRMKAILSGGVSQRKSSLLEGTPAEVAKQVVEFLSKERMLTAEQTFGDQ